MWETVKRHYSSQHETAAETAARVVMNGLLIEYDKIAADADLARAEEQNKLQGRLFE